MIETSFHTGAKPFWPRPHLSWSQMLRWEKDPKDYIRHYLYGDPDWTNPRMMLGREIAEMLQYDRKHDDPTKELIRTFITKYEHSEYELRCEANGVPLYGILDGFSNSIEIKIGENKTGTHWDQSMVDNHRQLDFYLLMVYTIYDRIPDDIQLHWIPTAIDEHGWPYIVGTIENFRPAWMESKQEIMRHVIKMGGDVGRIWKEIGYACGQEHAAMSL